MNKWGMHVPNEGFRNLEAFFTLGVGNFTGLDVSFDRTYEESADKHTIGRELRNRCPDARILVRFYGWSEGGHIVLSNWSIVDPIAWARQCTEWANSHRWLTDRFTLANEMNLPAEGGGWTKAWYQRINEWLVLAITEFRRLCPWAIVHWPALASGHSEDQDDNGDGTIGYEICAPSIRLCDVVDHHDYWHTLEQLRDPKLAQWHAFRFTRARAVLLGLGIDKPMFISECGWYGHMEEALHQAGAELVWFFEQLYDYPYILGATPFIWDSDDAHAGQRIGRCATTWWPIQSAEKQEVGDPEPIPPPPIPPPPEPLGEIEDIVDDLPRRGQPLQRGEEYVDRIIVHHTASVPSVTPEAVANWHVLNPQGPQWLTIAYHFFISQAGEIFQTLRLEEIGNHAGLANDTAVGIVLAGAFHQTDDEGNYLWRPPPPDVQQEALHYLTMHLQAALGIGDEGIQGHSAVMATQCPGPWFEDWKARYLEHPDETEALRRRVRQLEVLLRAKQDEVDNLNGLIDEVIRVVDTMR